MRILAQSFVIAFRSPWPKCGSEPPRKSSMGTCLGSGFQYPRDKFNVIKSLAKCTRYHSLLYR